MSLFRRIVNLGSRLQLDREMKDELRSHIEMRIEDNMAAGMSPKILQNAATVTGVGILTGLSGAFICAHFATALLFQTSSADPVSIGASVIALLIVAILAAVLPAGRAATISPMEALRSE